MDLRIILKVDLLKFYHIIYLLSLFNKMNNKIFITSALPYVNNILHLGNIIGSVLSADVHARFMRKKGHDVLFLCGTDEYGTTTEIKALQEGLTCQQICDKYYNLQKDAIKWFNISCDIFGRTTTDTQTELAQEIFIKLWQNNALEEKEVVQLYCETCNMFIADRYVRGTCYHGSCKGITKGDQCDDCSGLIDIDKLQKKWCNACKNVPCMKLSKHLFLKLGKYADTLQHFIDSFNNNNKYMSPIAIAITKSWLTKGLESRCITRDLKWGTPVPKILGLEEYWNKVLYVWFDAPIGYLSILKHDRPHDWQTWCNTGNWYQFMAKDNVPFHTIVFPTTLIGSEFPCNLVTHLSATEYLDFEGKKFSKTEGVGIFCDQVQELSQKLNIDEDYWRYYLIKIRPESNDSSFSWSEFSKVIKGELAQKIGNLVNRAVSLGKIFDDEFGKSKSDEPFLLFDFTCFQKTHSELLSVMANIVTKYEEFKYVETIKLINRIAEIGNEFINEHQIWNKIKKINNSQCDGAIYLGTLSVICWILAEYFEPVMPSKSKIIKKWFYIKKGNTNDFTFDEVYNIVKYGAGSININYDDCKILFNQIKITDLPNIIKT